MISFFLIWIGVSLITAAILCRFFSINERN